MPQNRPRLPKRETAEASRAYHEYAALGPDRSLQQIAEKMWYRRQAERKEQGLPTMEERKDKEIHNIRNQLGVWSSAHNWQDRVKKYDQNEIERKRRQRERELEKLNEDQATYGRAMSALAMKQIRDLIENKSFGSQAATLLFKYATDLERQARGASMNIAVEMSGKDGGPIESNVNQQVMVYLPKKEDLRPQQKIEKPNE